MTFALLNWLRESPFEGPLHQPYPLMDSGVGKIEVYRQVFQRATHSAKGQNLYSSLIDSLRIVFSKG